MTYVLLTLCYFAYGSLVSLHRMRRAALIPDDWVHEEIGDFGPPYEVNDREQAITHAWLAVPFWPVHELVSTINRASVHVRNVTPALQTRVADRFLESANYNALWYN